MEDASTCDPNKENDGDSRNGINLRPTTISDLPDELVVSILSHLPTKDAASTSPVARRWKSLWTQLWTWRAKLNFNGWSILCPSGNSDDEEDRIHFVNFMNQVLGEHHGETVDEFRIRFMMNDSFARQIDRWVEFAFAKAVKIFELNFAGDRRGSPSEDLQYNFMKMFQPLVITLPDHFPKFLYLLPPDLPKLERPKLLPLDFPSFNRLEALYLKYVDVAREVLEYFLSNCPNLEVLHVAVSNLLFGLRVSAPSLNLKHLELHHCPNMKDLEISAPNLVSFVYTGRKSIKLNLKSAPLLVDLSLGMHVGQRSLLFHKCRDFHSCFARLETLELIDLQLHGLGGRRWIPHFPRLRKLTVYISTNDRDDLLNLLPLIHAAPILQDFKMILHCIPTPNRRIMYRDANHQHQCLKVVEIVGFIGHEIDVEFVMSICDNAVSLEKVILDSRNPFSLGTPSELEETSERSLARENAEFLKTLAPPNVEFIIR